MVTMQMRILVTGVWLYGATGSGLQLGLLGLIQLAVQLPATLYGGTLADQIGAGNTLILGGLVSVVVVQIIWRSMLSIREFRFP